jgi:hypothetical protein
VQCRLCHSSFHRQAVAKPTKSKQSNGSRLSVLEESKLASGRVAQLIQDGLERVLLWHLAPANALQSNWPVEAKRVALFPVQRLYGPP